MKTSRASLAQWTVLNDPEENGEDQRSIAALFQVAPGSVAALAVAALSGYPARMTLDLGEGPTREGIETVCMINPPWGATKKGGFRFTAVMEYSETLVRQLTVVTQGATLVLGLDQVQEELDVSDERKQALEIFAVHEGDLV